MGTPCEEVYRQPICLYRTGVQAQFPEDRILGEWHAVGYCGVAFFDSAGVPLGHVAAIHDGPLPEGEDLLRDLSLASIRTGRTWSTCDSSTSWTSARDCWPTSTRTCRASCCTGTWEETRASPSTT